MDPKQSSPDSTSCHTVGEKSPSATHLQDSEDNSKVTKDNLTPGGLQGKQFGIDFLIGQNDLEPSSSVAATSTSKQCSEDQKRDNQDPLYMSISKIDSDTGNGNLDSGSSTDDCLITRVLHNYDVSSDDTSSTLPGVESEEMNLCKSAESMKEKEPTKSEQGILKSIEQMVADVDKNRSKKLRDYLKRTAENPGKFGDDCNGKMGSAYQDLKVPRIDRNEETFNSTDVNRETDFHDPTIPHDYSKFGRKYTVPDIDFSVMCNDLELATPYTNPFIDEHQSDRATMNTPTYPSTRSDVDSYMQKEATYTGFNMDYSHLHQSHEQRPGRDYWHNETLTNLTNVSDSSYKSGYGRYGGTDIDMNCNVPSTLPQFSSFMNTTGMNSSVGHLPPGMSAPPTWHDVNSNRTYSHMNPVQLPTAHGYHHQLDNMFLRPVRHHYTHPNQVMAGLYGSGRVHRPPVTLPQGYNANAISKSNSGVSQPFVHLMNDKTAPDFDYSLYNNHLMGSQSAACSSNWQGLHNSSIGSQPGGLQQSRGNYGHLGAPQNLPSGAHMSKVAKVQPCILQTKWNFPSQLQKDRDANQIQNSEISKDYNLRGVVDSANTPPDITPTDNNQKNKLPVSTASTQNMKPIQQTYHSSNQKLNNQINLNQVKATGKTIVFESNTSLSGFSNSTAGKVNDNQVNRSPQNVSAVTRIQSSLCYQKSSRTQTMLLGKRPSNDNLISGRTRQPIVPKIFICSNGKDNGIYQLYGQPQVFVPRFNVPYPVGNIPALSRPSPLINNVNGIGQSPLQNTGQKASNEEKDTRQTSLTNTASHTNENITTKTSCVEGSAACFNLTNQRARNNKDLTNDIDTDCSVNTVDIADQNGNAVNGSFAQESGSAHMNSNSEHQITLNNSTKSAGSQHCVPAVSNDATRNSGETWASMNAKQTTPHSISGGITRISYCQSVNTNDNMQHIYSHGQLQAQYFIPQIAQNSAQANNNTATYSVAQPQSTVPLYNSRSADLRYNPPLPYTPGDIYISHSARPWLDAPSARKKLSLRDMANQKMYNPKHYALEEINIGAFTLNFEKSEKRAKVKVMLRKGKLLYEFPFIGHSSSLGLPSSTFPLILVEIPFCSIIHLSTSKFWLRLEVKSGPLMFLGCQPTKKMNARLHTASFNRERLVDITSGELAKCPYHSIKLKSDKTAEIVKLLCASDDKFIERIVSHLQEDPDKVLPLAHHQQAVIDLSPESVEKPDMAGCADVQVMCRCSIGCATARCRCATNKMPCGVQCKCQHCHNPLSELVKAGIKYEDAIKDDCLTSNIFQISSIQSCLCQEVWFRCCNLVRRLDRCVPGVAACPGAPRGCDRLYQYSWCKGIMNDVTEQPIRHCVKCALCVKASMVHCDVCKTCFSPRVDQSGCPQCFLRDQIAKHGENYLPLTRKNQQAVSTTATQRSAYSNFLADHMPNTPSSTVSASSGTVSAEATTENSVSMPHQHVEHVNKDATASIAQNRPGSAERPLGGATSHGALGGTPAPQLTGPHSLAGITPVLSINEDSNYTSSSPAVCGRGDQGWLASWDPLGLWPGSCGGGGNPLGSPIGASSPVEQDARCDK